MNDHPLAPRVAAWLRDRLGPFEVMPWSPSGRRRHGVFRIAAGGGAYYLKLHVDARSWQTEVFAYRHWCPAAWDCFPQLVGVLEANVGPGILTRALRGQPLEGRDLPEPAACEVWRAAGSLAACLARQAVGTWFGRPGREGRPQGPSTLDAAQYVRRELLDWTRRAQQARLTLPSEDRLAAWATEQCTCFAGEEPRPVNRDFTDGNWLVDAEGAFVGAVDLEEMRWGTRAESFAHLFTKRAYLDPALQRAFFEGYGEPFLDRHPVQFRVAGVALGLATLLLGHQRRSAAHLARGHAILQRLDHPPRDMAVAAVPTSN